MREYGIPLDPFSRDNPKTLHATTGAWVAKRIFGENEAVFQAIASHTTGCGHMNPLQKIIYIADYMEPNRDFPGVERLRAAVDRDLDLAVLLGLEMTVEMLRHQGRRVARIPWKPSSPCGQGAPNRPEMGKPYFRLQKPKIQPWRGENGLDRSASALPKHPDLCQAERPRPFPTKK